MSDSASPQTEQVFLSYSRTNLKAAIAMRSALEQAGISTFRDEDSIRVGDNWMNRLQTTLQECSAFVLLIGRDGIQRWVMAETQIALIRHLSPHDAALRLPVFPVLLPDGDLHSLPPFLSLFQIQRWQPGEDVPEALLTAIRDKVELLDNSISFEGCPFLGLSAFQREHARLFFGRRRETLEALDSLGAQQATNPEQMHMDGQYCRWLQIEGNSGAGKSSLVNAGMLPMIEQGALWSRTGFEHWQVIGPMMPGEHPLRQLAESVEHALVADAASRDSGQRYRQFQEDAHAFVMRLRDFNAAGKAFLLVVDQFEELFTFADKAEKLQFDLQLYHALRDKDCPLFLISTVRIDFLEGFEQLPCLSELYNRHCKRYLLKTISQSGLREVIEQPARLAGLDVSAVTTAILQDAREEPGALPLVENALRVLWEERQGDTLSGELYASKGGIAGLLEEQADALLRRLESELNGREDALELLLALTRVNDEGRHTRRRLSLGEARLAAGGKKADVGRGQQIIDYLSGGQSSDEAGRLSGRKLARLIVIGQSTSSKKHVEIIHDMLVRSRGRDKEGRYYGHWDTLYQYIENNKNRPDVFFSALNTYGGVSVEDFSDWKNKFEELAEKEHFSRKLKYEAAQWSKRKHFKIFMFVNFFDFLSYKDLNRVLSQEEESFLKASYRGLWGKYIFIALFSLTIFESYLWTLNNGLPLKYMIVQQQFRLMDWGIFDKPLPEVDKEIQPPEGAFKVGEFDADFGEMANKSLEEQGALGQQNFGYPATPEATIEQAYRLGKYEVSYQQYDYFIWQQGGKLGLGYPLGHPSQNLRGQHAVANVSWNDANLYLKWLSDESGGEYLYRLPTEAEWEYAARAGKNTPFWWGGDKEVQNRVLANCDGCGSQWDNKYIAPVGSFDPNNWGIYDTAGNVWEWTCSAWVVNFSENSESLCSDPSKQTGARVLRGGSWDTKTDWLRSSARYRANSTDRSLNVGFRVYRSSRTP